MSTRSTTHFVEHDLRAIVYRHHDGYPRGHGADLWRFLTHVQGYCTDTRFGDAPYLASKLVVWLAHQYAFTYRRDEGVLAPRPSHPLDFLSVGIVQADPGDIEYRYVVDCGHRDEQGFPTVTGWDLNEDRPLPLVRYRQWAVSLPLTDPWALPGSLWDVEGMAPDLPAGVLP